MFFCDRPELYRGKVVLVGDSAHPITPNMGQAKPCAPRAQRASPKRPAFCALPEREHVKQLTSVATYDAGAANLSA
jgi:hypothetical protein